MKNININIHKQKIAWDHMFDLIRRYSNWGDCSRGEKDYLNACWMEHWKGRPNELLSVNLNIKESIKAFKLNYEKIQNDLFGERTLNNLVEQGIESVHIPGYYEAESCVRKYNKNIFQLEDTMKTIFSHGYYCLCDGNIDPTMTKTVLLNKYKIRNHSLSKIYKKLSEVGLKTTQEAMKGLYECSQKDKLGIQLPWDLYQFLKYTDNSLVQSRYFNSLDPNKYILIIFFLPFYIELLDDLRTMCSIPYIQRIQNDIEIRKKAINFQKP
ncbi:MAG: hypothetical protein OXC62_02195 [Aestuariivita sp.]|nr:hypothetical protein [Aestuariivita sp.]